MDTNNMELLLDTCTLLWALFDDKRLPQKIKDIINNPKNDIFVSAVSLWEIALKNDSHQELMPFSAKDVVNVMDNETDFQMIDIHYDAFLYLNDFSKQNIHHDPFDHLLLSIAKIEDFSLITCDKNMKKYQGVKIIDF